MICKCQLLIKKRTILDGIKSLQGTLIVYKLGENIYINECCAQTIIPAMCTFIDTVWFVSHLQIINVDTQTPSILNVFQISDKLLESIKYFGETLEIIYNSNIKSLELEYKRIEEMCGKAYTHVIELEKTVMNLRFKYMSAIQGKCILNSNNELETSINTPIHNDEVKKMVNDLKIELKDKKIQMHNQIGELVYTNAQQKSLIIELEEKNKKLENENANMREENKLLRYQR